MQGAGLLRLQVFAESWRDAHINKCAQQFDECRCHDVRRKNRDAVREREPEWAPTLQAITNLVAGRLHCVEGV